MNTPPLGEYILLRLNKTNWHDSEDPQGVCYVVAKAVRCGPEHLSYANNKGAPCVFKEFGPAAYYYHEVDEWWPLPGRGSGEY